MAIRTIIQPDFEVDTEIEKNTAWPDGSKVFVVATGKTYVLKSSVYIDITAAGTANSRSGSFGMNINGNGSPITIGNKGSFPIPYSGTITGWEIIGDVTGSAVIDVWKVSYASLPGSVANTITGSEKPTLTSQTKNTDTNLTTWTTSVTAGDYIIFNVDSASTVTNLTVTIKITKS